MQCPKCGTENEESHAACWSCFAQLREGPGGKPVEILFPKNAPVKSETAEAASEDSSNFVVPGLVDSSTDSDSK